MHHPEQQKTKLSILPKVFYSSSTIFFKRQIRPKLYYILAVKIHTLSDLNLEIHLKINSIKGMKLRHK